MKQFSKLLASLAVLTIFSLALIGCGNPSSGGGNSTPPPTYTTVAGGTYIDSSTNSGFIFYDNYSVSQRTRQGVEVAMGDAKWRIENDNTVEIYREEDGRVDVIYAFTATSDFTQLTLTMTGDVFNRQ